jgi:DNA-directed RNA polymerase subunit H (RpoH/RPB5)
MTYNPQYVQYNNLYLMLHDAAYRKLIPETKKIDRDVFEKQIHNDGFVQINSAVSEEKNSKQIMSFLTFASEFYSKSDGLKKIMQKIPDKKIDVIIITTEPIKKSLYKKLNNYQHVKFFNYPNHIFNCEISKATFCAKHTIIDKKEIEELKNFYLEPTMLNKIKSSDPQCIWIGAVPGDVIRIDDISPCSLIRTEYRYVR